MIGARCVDLRGGREALGIQSGWRTDCGATLHNGGNEYVVLSTTTGVKSSTVQYVFSATHFLNPVIEYFRTTVRVEARL
jgi:hypothetical protein